MVVKAGRLVLRDFREDDRPAFAAYQTDPRYARLYGFDPGDAARADALFDRFVGWARAVPRLNWQVGIFLRDGRLCGCAGLRTDDAPAGAAILGIELTPDDWGRHGVAVDAVSALLGFGFGTLGLRTILGRTASGNTRVERLGRWFGAAPVASRPGPEWMAERGWREVDWALTRDAWAHGGHRRR